VILDILQPSLRDLIMFHDVPRTSVRLSSAVPTRLDSLRSNRPSSSEANRQTAKPPASPSPLSISQQSKSLLRSLQQECSTMLINEDTDR
jgi:hypothetical protein